MNKTRRKGGFDKFTMDDYIITYEGNIINKKWGRLVKPQPNNKGYGRVNLCGKFYFVHRLVAEKYVPNPKNKPFVNHKDGNKTNNNADNLEWVTNQENRQHAVKMGLHPHGEVSYAKLTYKDVEYIRKHPEIPRKELAEKYGVSHSTISSVANYKSWKQ